VFNRASAKAVKVTAGVDWISATLGREEIDAQVWIYDALHALEQIAMAGNKYTRRKLLGFDGWECGGNFIGSSETMHYAQFTSHHAQMAYPYLEHPKVHVSRIDLQLTVHYDTEIIKEGRYQYARAVNHNKGLPKHRQRKIRLVLGDDGGDTAYIGAASSDTMLRIYNKDKQSADSEYARAWRYEVVYRNERANPVFRRIVTQADALSTVIIPSIVAYCIERGIEILDLGNWSGTPVPIEKRIPSDVERKMKWLKTQVVPTIRILCEMGYGAEVGDLLANALVSPDPHTVE